MVKVKFNKNIDAEDTAVLPTQVQMDSWMALELAEANEDPLLAEEPPVTIFNSDSID